jgi:hypothetical protein
MCKWGTRTKVNVIRRANPFVKDGWHEISVDSCIAEEIQDLNNKGIITEQCCCGHGKVRPTAMILEPQLEKCKNLGYEYEEIESGKYFETNEIARRFNIFLKNNEDESNTNSI